MGAAACWPLLLLLVTCGTPQAARDPAREAAAAARAAVFYSPQSFWNTPIGSDPVINPRSDQIVARSFLPFAQGAVLANDDRWGIAYVRAQDDSPVYTVICRKWCAEQEPLIEFRIPRGATPSQGSDRHLAVIDGNRELDMWQAVYDSTSDTWSAGTRFVNNLRGWGATCAEGERCNGAVAAGFALLGGAVRPEEIAAGRIAHALAITTPYTRRHTIACPATHTDGKRNDPFAIPQGARVQLDPHFDVDAQAWPAWKKVIARALQEYGAYVADTSGAVAIRGVTDQNDGNVSWESVGVPKGWREGATLSDLPWERLRVLAIEQCN